MTHEELRNLCAELGWSSSELAVKTFAHRNSASRWLNAKLPVPALVAAHVEMSVALVRLRREIDADISAAPSLHPVLIAKINAAPWSPNRALIAKIDAALV